MKSSLGMPTPWTAKEIESRSCPEVHANFNCKETGDDASQIIFIRKGRAMGRREEETSGMTGLKGILKLLQRDSTWGVKMHSENSLRSNYCITYCQRGQGQMQYTGLISK